jgi:hypothetical protein
VLETELVVAHVVTYASAGWTDRTVVLPTDLDLEGDAMAWIFPDVCAAMIGFEVRWTLATAIGSPAERLADLARRTRAAAVVVGADTAGWLARLRRGFSGSIPGQLARHVDVPVVVVPCSRSRRHRASSAIRAS